MFEDRRALAREIGRVHRLAVDVLVELLGMGREAVDDRLAVKGDQRHHRIAADLQRLEADIDRRFCVADQRGAEPVAELGRHQQRDLDVDMLGEQAEMVAQLVHRDADILGEEIAGVEDLAAVRIDQRIVVGAIGLGLDLPRRRREAVERPGRGIAAGSAANSGPGSACRRDGRARRRLAADQAEPPGPAPPSPAPPRSGRDAASWRG